jgi:predicted dehydrogenase
VQKSAVVFAVTHNYTGYPLVRQARDMVKAGELGEINAVRAYYLQGWLRTRLERQGQKQAGWRTDPKRSGAAGCWGDIGTHAYNLGRFITGLIPEQISCLLKTFVEGRALDDYGAAAIRYTNGALGTVTASQISHGRENDVWVEIDGTKASLEWHQEEPNKMWVRANGQPHRLYTRDPNADYITQTAKASCRLPSGHPEAFLEAFANLYNAAYADMVTRASGHVVDSAASLYPNVADGVDGMNFITQSVASSAEGGAWKPLKHPLCRA